MVSVVDSGGRSFCIDRYEWPNQPGRMPRTRVSWVEAKVACIDAGKRLCTRQEWESVCHGGSRNVYPYGDTYDKELCRTESTGAVKSGAYKKCVRDGVSDMVGNAGEWVEDRQGDYPYMMGGSYHDGKDAHCGLAMPGTIATRNDDTGFRCCR
jgi:formylglycine-generating enzyme required for sulfatase activity